MEAFAAWFIGGQHYAWVILVSTAIGIAVNAWAFAGARADVALVRGRLVHDRREDQATLMLAEHRVGVAIWRLAGLVLLCGWAAVTLILPSVGPAMTGRLLILLALRGLLLLGVSLVWLWLVVHDRRDHWRIVAYVRSYRERRIMGR